MRKPPSLRTHRAARVETALVSALVTLVSLCVVATGASAATSSCTTTRPVTGIELNYYPWVDTGFPSLAQHGLIADSTLLNAFATEYANHARRTVNGWTTQGPADIQNFFLFWLPERLNDIAVGRASPPEGTGLDLGTSAGLGKALWLTHLSGYYTGVWLRHYLGAAAVRPMNDKNLAEAYATAVDAPREVANSGSPAQVLAYVRHSVRAPTRVPADGDPLKVFLPFNGEVGIFGFDAQWLHLILPPNPNAPTNARPFKEPFFTYDPTKLLTASYAVPERPYLQVARQRYAAASSAGAEAHARLAEMTNGSTGETPLIIEQLRYHAESTALYETGIPNGTTYRGFVQPAYDQLLGYATYAVMTPQANSLDALAAYATKDVDHARQQIRTSALWWSDTTSYLASVLDGHNDNPSLAASFPHFTYRSTTACR
jgi:hypothetical protein